MGQTYVSIKPYQNGKTLIEAQNRKDAVSVVCKTNRVIINLIIIHLKFWMFYIRNTVADSLFMPGNLSKVKQEK